MGPLAIGMLAGAALGALRGEEGKKKEKEQRLLNSEITRYSPWTRINPEAVTPADQTGSILQGGMAGAMMGQGVANVNAQNAALAAQGAGQMPPPPGAMPPPMYAPGQGMPPYANASPWMGMSPYYSQY